jgi:hypothetical protein
VTDVEKKLQREGVFREMKLRKHYALARRKRKIRKKKEGTEASPEGEGAPFGLINAALQ